MLPHTRTAVDGSAGGPTKGPPATALRMAVEPLPVAAVAFLGCRNKAVSGGPDAGRACERPKRDLESTRGWLWGGAMMVRTCGRWAQLN